MKPIVLIVGQMPDSHIESVAQKIEDLGGTPVVFNRVCPEESKLTYWLSENDAGGEIIASNNRCRLGQVKSVWWRVKPFSFVDYGAAPLSVTDGFIQREWRSVLDSLWVYMPGAFWINSRPADLLAANKPVQLQLAQQAGFPIPITRITNDPDEVSSLLQSGEGQYIYKPVTWYADLPDRFIFTSQLYLKQVENGLDEIRVAPGIFQKRIVKKYEVRATVVGDSIFAVKINSQDIPGADLDWRRRQHHLNYTLHQLPDDICQRLLNFHHKLGLVFGAYDLIVTPDNEHYFLEVNPIGQWLWLERFTEIPISQALAKALVFCPGV